MIRRKVRVPQHYREASPAAQEHELVKGDAALHRPGRPGMPQVVPAERSHLGGLHGGLKCQRVAVIDTLTAPLKDVVAVLGQRLQDFDAFGRERDAERMTRLHVAAGYPSA